MPFLALFNSVVLVYLNSLIRDLVKSGFEIILIIVSSLWIAHPFLILILFLSGNFFMPIDPVFYAAWLGVVFFAITGITLFVNGLRRAEFFDVESLGNLSFFTTALYAALFLGEKITATQFLAMAIAAVGIFLFFDWRSSSRRALRENKGLELVLVAIFLVPFAGIFYKTATLHTSSYYQFLSGRLVMDLAYWSVFLFLLFFLWYKKNPFLRAKFLLQSRRGMTYVVVNGFSSLIDSWLIFKLPISFLALLNTVSVPAGYFISRMKYRDHIRGRHILGGALIVFALILFIVEIS